MAYLLSLVKIRKIAIFSLVLILWSQGNSRKHWANQEFGFALRNYEYFWQTRLSDEDVSIWQRKYLNAYLGEDLY